MIAAPADDLAPIGQPVAPHIVRDVAALGHRVGCSIGVAVAPIAGELKNLLDRADHAMLAAKRAGRNRVEVMAEAA